MSVISNEQTKLTATAMSDTALAFIIAGLVAPVVSLSLGLSTAPAASTVAVVVSFAWFVAGVALHVFARLLLRRLTPLSILESYVFFGLPLILALIVAGAFWLTKPGQNRF